jgi:hypothetical protein
MDSTKSVPRQLQVEIHSIGYSTSTGFWTGGVETKAAVMCHASVASNTYDKMYRYSGEERVVWVPTADHNSQLINKAVNEVRRRRVAGTRLRPPRPAYGLDYQMTRCVRRTFEFPNRNE